MPSPTRSQLDDNWEQYENSPEYGDDFYKDTKMFFLYSIACSLKSMSEKN